MSMDDLDSKVFMALDPLDIESYLRYNSWKPDQYVSGEVSIWNKTDEKGERFRVWLPFDYRLGDFSESIDRLVTTVAQAEKRSRLSVIEDLQTVTIGDVIRIRAFDNLQETISSLQIDEGIALFEQARNLVTAAANSAYQTRPVHPIRKSNKVIQYLNSIRLGQTERGSYIAKLISPLKSQQLPLPDIEPPAPFAREAIIKLVQGLTAVRDAAADNHKRDRFIFGIFEEAVSDGVSANLCEAVTTRGSLFRSQAIEISVSWGYVLDIPLMDQRAEIEIPIQYMGYISEAARSFRETNPEPSEISGFVIALRKEDGPGTITLATIIDNKQRKVRIDLNDEDYHQALIAHDNEYEIVCSGDLVQRGRQYHLTNLKTFNVIK